MRILFVTDFYHPYSGGVELHVRTVAAALAARGHRVAVATLPAPPGHQLRDRDRRADGGVEVHTVHHSAERIGARFAHQDRPWAPPFPDPVAAVGLRAVIADFRPDVIHGHDWLARSALPRAVSGGVPTVTSYHYYTRTCAKKTLWHEGAICSGPALQKCLRCAADHYGPARGAVVTLGLRIGARLEDARTERRISVSQATAAGNDLTGRPGATVVANPVPRVGIGTDSARSGEADSMDTNGVRIPDGPFILFVGDIRPEKGVAVLARAVERLRSDHDDGTPLVVVGERMSHAITLPANSVEVGPVANEVVQQLWRRAAIGVVPSLWPEPFGLVAIEAMAAGCPLVASDVGGLSEILADGRGTLVSPDDPVALATAIAELLADPDRRVEQAVLAGADVSRYDTNRIVAEIEAQYELAIGRQ